MLKYKYVTFIFMLYLLINKLTRMIINIVNIKQKSNVDISIFNGKKTYFLFNWVADIVCHML